MKTIPRSCEFCNMPFNASQKEVKRGNAKFCSISCGSKRPRKKIEPNNVCAVCGLEFFRSPSKMKNAKHGFQFCSRKCKELAQSVKSVHAIKEILPPHYGDGRWEYRRYAFENFNNSCNRCGYDECKKILEVHHKDRDKSNNDLTNLEILCPNCHAKEHLSDK